MSINNENITIATTLFFLGFPGLGNFKVLLFLFIFFAYTTAILVDVVIIVLVTIKKSLCSPMYFFLKNFLFSEMFLGTLVVPNMLRVIWLDGAFISIAACITQSYLFISIGSSECCLLAAMSYDRYLAICKPLHYNSIMDFRLQYFLVITCNMVGLLLPLITLGLLVKLKFCDHNVIDHYFCDLAPIMNIACSDTSALQINIFVLSFPMVVMPFVFIIVSYMCIFIIILGIPTITGRKKAFSTCSSHLIVVGMFFGAVLINYYTPVRKDSVAINKMFSVIFTVLTPLINPIIYSLRNQDMRVVLNSYIYWRKRRSLH